MLSMTKSETGLFNYQAQKENRRALRKNQTEPERRFWQAVRGKQLGVKFRRQQGIGPYIVDFYCAELKLVVELDGESHYTDEGLKHDQERDAFLREHGLKVIRFTNIQIMQELDAVLELLLRKIEA